jgi:glycosyltransferase involved in cell wall biosynthesis
MSKRQKVLFYTRTERGGAGIAAKRIYDGVRDSKPNHLKLKIVFGSNVFIEKIFASGIKFIEKNIPIIKDKIKKKVRKNQILTDPKFETFELARGHKFINKPSDISHLHWIAGTFDFKNIVLNSRSIVWTIHDEAAITGGCHYSWNCDKFKVHCQECPQLIKSDIATDVVYDNFSFKINALRKAKELNKPVYFIATSLHMKDKIENSYFYKENLIKSQLIHLGVDTNKFRPRGSVRQKNNIKNDDLVFCFGADHLNNIRKGGDRLRELLENITIKVTCLIFGEGELSINNKSIRVIHFGKVNSEEKLAEIYSAADVFFAFSRHEAFGQTCLEAMSCETAIIATKGIGFDDQVTEDKNGYLIEFKQIKNLSIKIESLVKDRPKIHQLKLNSRKIAIHKFDTSIATKNYIALYNKIDQELKR